MASARLRGPLPIDNDATYDSGAEYHHLDWAARWSHTIGDFDLGLAHFRGTSREPRLLPRQKKNRRFVLVPHYDIIDQTSLDAQWTKGAWLWKLETITRRGHADRFFASVGGFEYTFFQLFSTDADLGVLGEYLYDGRDARDAPPTVFDHDVFGGFRLALNDVSDTSILGGAVVDHQTAATLTIIEAERRFGQHWRLEIVWRGFFNTSFPNPEAAFQRDSFLTLRLSRFF